MSEGELHILKGRMHEGRRAKAQRGELISRLPRGYVPEASGEIALDPDEGVRRAIGLVFAVFERRRSVSGVLRYFVDHEIQLPDRVRTGPDKGDVCWNRPNRATLSNMLRHPAYAGLTSMAGAIMTAASGCRASHAAADGFCVSRSAGRCCIKQRCRPTLTGPPSSGTGSRWPAIVRA